MAYRIEFTRRAAKDMEQVPSPFRERIAARIEGLARTPRPPSSKKLSDKDGFYRIRVGDYRVIYQVIDRVVLVTIIRIAHRREAYR